MVYQSKNVPFPLVIGREYTVCPNIEKELKSSLLEGFDFILLPLFHPRNERNLNSSVSRNGPMAKPDTIFSSSLWSKHIIGKLSRNIDVDSNCDEYARESEFYLREEIEYAFHLGISDFIIPPIKSKHVKLARIINSYFDINHPNCFISVMMPMNEISWDYFNSFRLKLDVKKWLGVCLIIPNDLPENAVLQKWLSEPVFKIILNKNSFFTSYDGRITISKQHQNLIILVLKRNINIVIKGNSNKGSLKEYYQCIKRIYDDISEYSLLERMNFRMNEIRQLPIQPLKDNLSSQIYENFERDKTKYQVYKSAIVKALENFVDKDIITIFVLGAGRAPLITVCFEAATLLQKKIFVYAVEKNKSAINTLKHYANKAKLQNYNNLVVINEDIRWWNPKEKADIVVSELLGSFGDNELSPECLDLVGSMMNPNGICIPKKYSSYILPIACPIVYEEIKFESKSSDFKLEYPCVCNITRFYSPFKPLECFQFNHPDLSIRDLFKQIRFKCSENMLVSGFLGYFDAYLFQDIHLSTCPTNATPNMYSWFPIFFPIKKEMFVVKDNIIEISIWRLKSKKKVWYEWLLEVLDHNSNTINSTTIHNKNGDFYHMEL